MIKTSYPPTSLSRSLPPGLPFTVPRGGFLKTNFPSRMHLGFTSLRSFPLARSLPPLPSQPTGHTPLFEGGASTFLSEGKGVSLFLGEES